MGRFRFDFCRKNFPGKSGCRLPAACLFCSLSGVPGSGGFEVTVGDCGGADRSGAGHAAAAGGPKAALRRLSHSCSRCQPWGSCRVRWPRPCRALRAASAIMAWRMVAPAVPVPLGTPAYLLQLGTHHTSRMETRVGVRACSATRASADKLTSRYTVPVGSRVLTSHVPRFAARASALAGSRARRRVRQLLDGAPGSAMAVSAAEVSRTGAPHWATATTSASETPESVRPRPHSPPGHRARPVRRRRPARCCGTPPSCRTRPPPPARRGRPRRSNPITGAP
jgi:hypothetical protein